MTKSYKKDFRKNLAYDSFHGQAGAREMTRNKRSPARKWLKQEWNSECNGL